MQPQFIRIEDRPAGARTVRITIVTTYKGVAVKGLNNSPYDDAALSEIEVYGVSTP